MNPLRSPALALQKGEYLYLVFLESSYCSFNMIRSFPPKILDCSTLKAMKVHFCQYASDECQMT